MLCAGAAAHHYLALKYYSSLMEPTKENRNRFRHRSGRHPKGPAALGWNVQEQ
jgi:hypothetical protein